MALQIFTRRSLRAVSYNSLIVWVQILFIATSWAAEIEGVQFAEVYRSQTTILPLKGVGLARYLRTIKVYAAALYVDKNVKPEELLSDVPKRLELQYFRALNGPDFGKAAEEVMAGTVPKAQLASLRPRIDRMHALYEDVKPGDRYSLTYIPGIGTELALNGQPKGTVEGADFAAAYFAIWLGSKPISESLKAQMLDNH